VALARGTLDADLERRLVARVSGDPWGLVRVQAADALASGTAPTVDEALGAAVDLEPLEKVRAALVTSLGVRKATSQRLVVSSRATDEKEALEVRMAAMVALGAMCDRESLELLTETAQRGVAPQLERQHRLSAAAIRALGLTGLPDLPTRLQLVLSGGVPDLRDLAKRALEPVQKPSCTPSAPRAD
jgi:HEAT repeat protein